MTKPLPFTRASLRRAIIAAQKAGLRVPEMNRTDQSSWTTAPVIQKILTRARATPYGSTRR
jgi:hypothetical protein